MSAVPGSAISLSYNSPCHLHPVAFCVTVRVQGRSWYEKATGQNNPPEEWELTLTLEPEEEEQPEPGDGSALTDEDILLLGYLGRHLGGKK